jgi:hypothetical protein
MSLRDKTATATASLMRAMWRAVLQIAMVIRFRIRVTWSAGLAIAMETSKSIRVSWLLVRLTATGTGG